MLSLMIVADFFLLATNTGYVIELNDTFESNHLLMLKLMTAVGTAGLNLLLNVFHWLFSYEYLQVSFSFDLRQKEFKP
jgi:hypothetical protein